MALSMEWFSVFILGHPLLQYVIIFLGAAFGGEFILFVFGFITAQGILPVFALVLFSFLGTLFSDVLWFFLGRTAVMGRMISHRYAHVTISIVAEAIERVSRGNSFIAIIFAKFLIGTRILIIMYLSKNNLELKKFIRYDIVAILLWLSVVISIGFLAGLGFTYVSHVLKNIYAGFGFVLLVLLIFVITNIWLKKTLAKRGENII